MEANHSSSGCMQDHPKFACNSGLADLLLTTTKVTKAMLTKVCVNMGQVPLLLLGVLALSGPATVLVSGECFGDGGARLTLCSTARYP